MEVEMFIPIILKHDKLDFFVILYIAVVVCPSYWEDFLFYQRKGEGKKHVGYTTVFLFRTV